MSTTDRAGEQAQAMLEDDVGLSLTPPGLEQDSSGRNPSPSNTPEQRKPTERTENTHTASACPLHVEGQMAGQEIADSYFRGPAR